MGIFMHYKTKKALKSLTIAWVICLMASTAYAADPAPQDYKIEPQSVSTALKAFAAQSNMQLIFTEQDVGAVKTAGVVGTRSPREALSEILQGTGLEFEFTANRVIVVRKTHASQSASTKPTANATNPQGNSALRLAQATRNAVADAGPTDETKAQSESSPEPDKDKLSEIIVTGSRLHTDKTASPVIVITAEEIKQQGLSTAEDVIRSITQNFSETNAATTAGTNGLQNQSAADLRGLGSENTLVLVDGRRRAIAPGFFNGTVNLNTIPMAAVDHVEIMTDGASAVYGSDAIAGVINFIMKKDYQGGETSVRQEVAANGGNATSVNQTLGETWSTGNVLVGARYVRSSPVNLRRVGWATEDFTSLGGSDFRSPYLGQPGISDFGSLPANDDGTHGIAGKLSPANNVPFDPGLYSQYISGTPEARNFSIELNGEQRLTTHVRAYTDLTYSDNTSVALGGPAYTPSGYYDGSGIDVPTTNRFNDTGATVTNVGYVFGNELLRGLIPAPSTVGDQKAYSGTLGLKFDLPFRDWTADVSGSRSYENSYYFLNDVNRTLLRARLTGVDAQGNPVPAAQQLNVFGNGTAQNPAAVAGLISNTGSSTLTSTLDSGLASVEGSVLKLPGGAMRLAMGFEVRKEIEDYRNISATEPLGLLTLTPSRTVKAGFLEGSIPIVGDHNQIPGIHALDVFAAVRTEQYAVNGPFDGPALPSREVTFSHVSPKYGISWYPLPELKLRATVSDSFRAPNLQDLFGGSSFIPNGVSIVDPQNPGEGPIFANAVFAGNPELRPETSHNFAGGFNWNPTGRLNGLSVTTTYQKIDFTNRIESTFSILYEQPNVLFDIPGIVQRGANGQITQLNMIPVNLDKRRSENLDLTTTYDFDTHAGKIRLGFSGTYAILLDEVVAPGSAPITQDGTQAGPEKHKWRTWISWSRSAYRANLYVNHSGAYTNTNISAAPNDFGVIPGPQSVSGYTTYDLTGSYRIESLGLSFNGGARNLTDAKFPFFNNPGSSGPWDAQRVDLRGRVIFLEITKKYGLPGTH
jgi:iron complex outermembrane receptor protein